MNMPVDDPRDVTRRTREALAREARARAEIKANMARFEADMRRASRITTALALLTILALLTSVLSDWTRP